MVNPCRPIRAGCAFLATGAYASDGVPDVIDIKVSFSEPVVASCGTHNDMWTTPQQYPGLRYRVCTSIKLVLTTLDNSTSGAQNHNSTTGTAARRVQVDIRLTLG